MSRLKFVFDQQSSQVGANVQLLTGTLADQAERALDQAAAVILNRLRTDFVSQKAPDGSPWLPSAAGERRRSEGKGQTLFDTGKLFRSIQLYKSGKGEREIGTDVEYAPYLNYGTKSMPARPFIFPSEDQMELAYKVFEFRMKELSNE